MFKKVKYGDIDFKYLINLKENINDLGNEFNDKDKVISFMHYINNLVTGLIGDIFMHSRNKIKNKGVNHKLINIIEKKIEILDIVKKMLRSDVEKIKKGINIEVKSKQLIDELHSKYEKKEYFGLKCVEDTVKKILNQ